MRIKQLLAGTIQPLYINFASKIFFLLLILMLSNRCFSQDITVERVFPAPNYPSKQIIKLSSLTGGSGGDNYWLGKNWIGWERRQKIGLIVKLNDADRFRNHAATLKVHTRIKKKAGVFPPLSIDVYSIEDGYQLLGSYLQTQAHLNSNKNLLLEVPVNKVTDQMLLVVHANGQYIQISEIQLELQQNIESVSLGRKLPTEKDAIKASTDRLIRRLIARSQGLSKDIIRKQKVSHPILGIAKQKLWEGLTPDGISYAVGNKVTFDIKGFKGEHEYIVFSLINYSKDVVSGRLDIDNNTHHTLDLMEVKPIVAADGNVVFDPLLPIDQHSQITLQPESIMILFGKIKLVDVIQNGTIKARFLSDNISRASFDINIETVHWEWEAKDIFAHNWAYSHQQPIWRNRESIEHDLFTHGVNVKVMHNSQVPRIVDSRKIYDRAKLALVSELKQARRSDFILLYLGLHPNQADKYIHKFENTELKIEALKVWLGDLKSTLEQAGYNTNQWALYPFDEPKGKNMDVVADVYSALKSADSEINIFVTPDSGGSRNRKTTASDLNKIVDYVDVWQPNHRLIKEVGSKYFTSNKPKFWFYKNPDYPAKSSSVYDSFRSLGIDAWSFGARGVGFWSYSDTRKSSAWSDFDSNWGDWAVVYESEKGPVSSMRWEAFLDGVEDMKQLYSVQDKLNTSQEKEIFVRRINNIIKIKEKAKVPLDLKQELFLFIGKLKKAASDNERSSR
jgi:Glycoside hydrolase 123, catalytic domain